MAKKTKTAKPRQRRPKQAWIPGTEPVRIQEIDDAAESYVTARDTRMEFGLQEKKYASALLDLMHKHEQTAYEYDGKIVSIGAEEKIKVKRKKDKTEENGDGSDE